MNKLDDHLLLGTGIDSSERVEVLGALETLESRLGALDQGTLAIEAWVKNRGDDDQIVYLSVRAADTDIVAHDQSSDFSGSLIAARNDLRRQLSDVLDRRHNQAKGK